MIWLLIFLNIRNTILFLLTSYRDILWLCNLKNLKDEKK